jgi:ACS family tartrate transporter-like MFS transporter
MLLYLTYWFPPSFRARCTASIQSAIPLAFILGGPISGLILQMDGIAALHGWQWLFVLEGMPAVVLAFVVLAILPESPAEARFLSDEEKHAAIARLAAEDTSEHRSALRALVDLRVIAIGVAFMAYVSTTYGVQLWLPQIVQAAGFSVFATGLIVPLPFLAAVPAMMLWGWSSDITGERTWHVALPMLAAGAALLVASAAPNNAIVLCALFIAVIATLLAVPVFNSLPGLLLGGKAAAAAIGLNLSISNLGGLLGPFLVGVLMERTGDYVEAMAAAAVAAAVIVVALGRSIGPRAVSPAVAGA